MIDLSLLDPAAIAFVLGLIVPLFVYTTRGARPNSTANRLARSNGTSFVDSLLSDNGTNITLNSGIFFGSTGAGLKYSFTDDTDTGLSHPGGDTDELRVRTGGTDRLSLGSDLTLTGTGVIGWTSGVVDAVRDVLLRREGVGVLQLGTDAASPVAQTFKGPDAIGTDIAGADLTTAPGRGTGAGLGGTFRIATAPAGVSGTDQNALVDRFIIGGAGAGSMADLTVSSLTGAAGYRGISIMNSGTTVVSVAATAARSGAVVLTQILQYVGDVNSQAGFSTGVQSVRAGAFEIVAIGSRAPLANAPVAWFVLR